MSERVLHRLAFIIGIGTMVLMPLFWAWAIMVLWNWFLPGGLHLPSLPYPAALGIVCISEILTFKARAESLPKLTGGQLLRLCGSILFQQAFAAGAMLALGGVVYLIVR